MPVIAFWIEGALYFVAGEGTRKARNLAHDGRCVIATGSTKLPSMDIVAEGRGAGYSGAIQPTVRRRPRS